MVPKIHAKGASFAGIAQYLLHDKDRSTTSDRVAWTSTRNLISEDPHHAWKIMAATAMDADRLKANAGIKNTGRKSVSSVLHLSLAWHPKEGEGLIPEEMQRAANLAIKALGADDRQVLMVCHNDEEQPHVHIVINRVSPETGKMLPSSKEKLNLSRFAQDYEEQRGEILCEQRKLNNDARDRGEYVRGEKDTPRHIYEQHNANDNRPGNSDHHRKQREKDQEIGKQQRAIQNKQANAWSELMQSYKVQQYTIRALQKTETLKAKDEIRKSYRDHQWKQLFHEHQAEMRAFNRDESTFLGRMKNRLKSMDIKELVGAQDRVQAISNAFGALSSSGARKEWLKKNQLKRERTLKSEQRAKENQAALEARDLAKERQIEARVKYEADRAALVFKCSGEAAKMRAQWKSRSQQRVVDTPTIKPQQGGDPRGKQTIQPDEHLERLLSDHQQRIESAEHRRKQDRDPQRGDDEIDR